MADDSARREEAIARFRQLVEGIRIAMLTTRRSDGTLRSRPMMTQEAGADGDLWFFTSTRTAKAEDIGDDEQVNVSYVDEGHDHFVSVSGRARLVHDPPRARELWRVYDWAWFPGGPDDPTVALIRVTVEEAQYWDVATSRLVQLAGLVRALATGEPYESATTVSIDGDELDRRGPHG